MREMKDSVIEWIGEIPKNWKITRCKYVSSFINGYAFDSTDLKTEYDYPVVRIGNIKDGYVDCTECIGINDNSGLEKYLVKENDILLAMSGATVGKVGIASKVVNSYINQRVGIIRTDAYNFLYYCLILPSFVEFIMLNTSSSAQPNVSSGICGNFKIPFPPLSEQQRIASYLDTKCYKIDDIIEKQQSVIEKLKAYKQSIITEAVTKGLNPDVPMKDSGYDFIGIVPDNWEVCRLRNIGTLQNGISKGGEFFGHGYPFVSYGDVYRNFSLPETVAGLVESTVEEQKQYSVQKGDIFFTRTSETIEEVGLSSVCEKTIDNATFAGFLIRVRPFKNIILPSFSKYYFRSNHHRFYLVKEMNLVTRASLGQTLLKAMPVLLPPMGEQKQIADYLDQKCSAIDSTIANKQALIEKLTAYKKSLIYEVVTGKKEV